MTPAARCLLPHWDWAETVGGSDATQAAKQLLPSEARPGVTCTLPFVTCTLTYTLPGVSPGLCKAAEVQAQQPYGTFDSV